MQKGVCHSVKQVYLTVVLLRWLNRVSDAQTRGLSSLFVSWYTDHFLTIIFLFHFEGNCLLYSKNKGWKKEREKELKRKTTCQQPICFSFENSLEIFPLSPLHIQIDPAEQSAGTGRSAQSRLAAPLSPPLCLLLSDCLRQARTPAPQPCTPTWPCASPCHNLSILLPLLQGLEGALRGKVRLLWFNLHQAHLCYSDFSRATSSQDHQSH